MWQNKTDLMVCFILRDRPTATVSLRMTPQTVIVYFFAGSSNGRIHDSESWNLGSNPSPAAVL